MANTIPSPNMSLPVPVAGVDPGPDWALNLNACMSILDTHNHAAGNGVPITPGGMNISTDLPFNNNNLISARSLRMTPQPSVLGGASDLNCVSVVGVDLYFNDGSGNKIRITQSGGIAGSPGSISNLTSPASASYVAGSTTFVWQSAANTAAIMDSGSLKIRNATASSHAMTVNPPAAMGSDFSITFPTAPLAQKIMTMDASGNIGAAYDVDNSTLVVTSNLLGIASGGVGTTQLANQAVTLAKQAIKTISNAGTAGNVLYTPSSGNYSTTSSSPVTVSNLTGTFISLGSPVWISLVPDGSGTQSTLGISKSGGLAIVTVRLTRDGTEIASWILNSGTNTSLAWPCSSFSFLDVVGAGSYTYAFQVSAFTTATTISAVQIKMIAYEI